VLDSEIGEERMREKRFSAITFAIVFCFLLAAPLIANTSFPNSNLSKDKILENSEESILESSVYYDVADGLSGLTVIDISDPTNPVWIVNEVTTGYTSGVYVSGDYAYMADGFSGLAAIDISDPTNPGMPVYADTTGEASGVYVNGDYAYVADWGSGLAVIDISDL
jgi:hypothetical protein